jgi:hypothetical protein
MFDAATGPLCAQPAKVSRALSQLPQQRCPARNVVIDLCTGGRSGPGRARIAAYAVASPETSAPNSASRQQRWSDNVDDSNPQWPRQSGFHNPQQQAAWTSSEERTLKTNTPKPEYGQSDVSSGWGVGQTSEDDSGWGSPEPMMDWGGSPSPGAGGAAGLSPDDWPEGPGTSGQNWQNGYGNYQADIGSRGNQGQQWQQPGSGGVPPPPGTANPQFSPGQPGSSSHQQWDFFADGYQAPRSGRWGPDPRFGNTGPAEGYGFNQPPQEPINAPWPASDITHLSRSEMVSAMLCQLHLL